MANDKFEQLLKDPDFISLPEEHQNQIIDEMRQKDFGSIPKTEGLLQRVTRNLTQPSTRPLLPIGVGDIGVNPLMSAARAGVSAMGIPEEEIGRYAGALMTPENPILGGLTTGATSALAESVKPLRGEKPNYLRPAIEGVSTAAIGGAIKAFPFVKRVLVKPESEKEAVRAGLFKKMIHRRSALTRAYGAELDKSKALVDISDIQSAIGIEPTGPVTLREAQEFKNTISEKIPELIKSGKKISPKFTNEKEIAGEITDRMIKADPNFAPVIKKYGEKAEAFKTSVGQFAPSTTGSEKIYGKPDILGFRQPFLGGSGSRVATEQFAPKVFKTAQKERTAENLRRLGQAALIGTPLSLVGKKLVPSVFQNTFRRMSEGL